MQETITAACENGLLRQDDETIQTTAKGQQHLNELLQYWVDDTPGESHVKSG
jgi:hypothetical protein